MKKHKIKIGLMTIMCLVFFENNISAQDSHKKNDSTANYKVLKSFNSYFNTNEIKQDRSFVLFHIFRKSQKEQTSISDLGNMGLPAIYNSFEDRVVNYNVDFIFNTPFDLYLKRPQEVIFFNTRRPYTKLMHTSSTKVKDEQTIGVIHSRNINPQLNFTLNYNLISSKGQYPNQKSKINTIVLNSNYQSEKYSLYTAMNLNRFTVENNGGVIDTGLVDTESPETNLSEASTKLYNSHFFALQEYRIGRKKTFLQDDSMITVLEPRIKFTHFINFVRRNRVYRDKQSFENGFYSNFYIKKDRTADSVSLNSIQNVLAVHGTPLWIKENGFGFDAFISGQYNSYYNFEKYIFLQNKHRFFDTKVGGQIFSDPAKKLMFGLSGEYYLSGYRLGDHKFETNIKYKTSEKIKSILSLNMSYSNGKPDYFLNTFYSNHFKWKNDFDSEINFRSQLKYQIPGIHFQAKAFITSIKNYTFFTSVALPIQFNDWLKVYSLQLQKDFYIGRVTFVNRVQWQKTSNENIINLPQISLYNATSVRLNVKHALVMYAGLDIEYFTKYKPYSFMPGNGMFYFENSFETGNYPIISAFINGKIKENVTFFVKYTHLNSGMIAERYYAIKSYPIKDGLFKFGVQWIFTN